MINDITVTPAAEVLAPKLSIVLGHLVEEVGEHTCGFGGDAGHDPTCGYDPVMTTEELAQLVLEHIERRRFPLKVLSAELRSDGVHVVAEAPPTGLRPDMVKGLLDSLRIASVPAELCEQRPTPVAE